MSYATKAVERALAVANDDSVGYQWGGWGPEFDCGHLIIDAYERAGFPVKSHGGAASTHNMREAWLACGGSDVTGKVNRSTGAGMLPGDVCVNKEHHAVMYIGNGKIVHARSNFDGKPGDSSGKEICVGSYYNYPWDFVLRAPDAGSTPAKQPAAEPNPAPKPASQYHDYIYLVRINLLKKGDYGPQVKSLQALLNAKGFNCGKADGIFGANTENALMSFQEAAGIPVDGEFGGQSFALWDWG